MNLWRKTPPPPRPALAEPLPCPPVLWRAPRPRASRPWVHVLLFVLTLVAVTTAGALQQGVDPFASLASLVHLSEGIPFALTLLGILTVHEFGHYFAARKWGIKASLPYFLPLPYISFLGTLGAVIKLRSPIPHKRALLDIGAAGPLAGFVVALAASIVGLAHSTIVQTDYFHRPPIQLGSPLLFRGIAALVLPEISSDQMVLLDPVAFAGWVGLFITAFNLFPVGQLDGGHIVYALFDKWHRVIARAIFAILLGMGMYGIFSLIWGWPRGWHGWLVLAFLIAVFGKDHPAPYNPIIPLDPRRRYVGYLCLIVFALCFTPVPFNTT